MTTRRNIGLCIVLSLVTCGIYALYWLAVMADDMNRISNESHPTSGGLVVVLTLITCGIYGWFWLGKAGATLDNMRVQNGEASGSLAILFIILAIFGLPIVSYAFLQNELNKYAPPEA